MSSHVLDVSGARPLTTKTNDPASTYVQMPAKGGDDIQMQLGGCREIRMTLPPSAKLQVRRYIRRSIKYVDGVAQKNPENENEYLYDEGEPYEELVLVMPGSVSMFGRTSRLESDPEDLHESWPHTTVRAQRQNGLHASESGDLVREMMVGDAQAWLEQDRPELTAG